MSEIAKKSLTVFTFFCSPHPPTHPQGDRLGLSWVVVVLDCLGLHGMALARFGCLGLSGLSWIVLGCLCLGLHWVVLDVLVFLALSLFLFFLWDTMALVAFATIAAPPLGVLQVGRVWFQASTHLEAKGLGVHHVVCC